MKITQVITGRIAAAAVCAILAFTFVPSKGHTQNNAPAFETAKELFSQGYLFFNKMNYLAAAEYFRKALSVYPDYYTAREYLARSYRLAGYSDEALTEWELLLKDSDAPSVQSKIDALRFREIAQRKNSVHEYVLARSLETNELGSRGFPYPSSVALDSEKNLYVSSFTAGLIRKFDAAGDDAGSKSFGGAKIYGLDCFGTTVAATDFAGNRLLLLNDALSVKAEIGGTGEAPGKFHGPEGVTFDTGGYIYVVDSGNARVQKFSPDGKFILAFGKSGAYEGDLASPTGCAIDGGDVYVTDSGNKRIAVFDDSGNFKENIQIEGLVNPKGITISGSQLVIADEKNGICFYDRAEKTVSWFKTWKDESESFSRTYDMAFDRDGFLYALDHGRQSVFVFTPLESKYTNLDVEISSIDIAKYPLVAFYLNVRSRSGAPVYNLKPSQFEVIEDGAHIRSLNLDYLKDQTPSVSATILLDRSMQAKPFHGKMTWASDFFLRRMHKNDQVKILNVNNDYWTGNNFDWSRLRSLKAIEDKTFGEGKKIGKALYNAIGELAPKLNRRAVMVMTDGSADAATFAPYSVRQIINYANTHFVQVYFVSFGAIDPSFSQIAESTGGFAVRASDADRLGSMYERIKSSEEYRYVLVYRSFKTEDFAHWWSDVTIKVALNGVSGVEWGGYFVPLPKEIKYKPSKLKLPGAGGKKSEGGEAKPAAAAAAPAAGGGAKH
jgi:DNA-binding beta-propeller fold protein YncE